MQYEKRKIQNTEYRIRNTQRAFTLIELMAVTGIVVIITSVVLANNNKYGGSGLLQNLAYDIALSIRQAQVYGISVRGFGANNSTFNVAYGMHFAKNDQFEYELFADSMVSNGLFDIDNSTIPPTSENVDPSPYQIGRGYYILDLCAPAGTKVSNNVYSCTSISQLDVLYKRPEPDAWISANGNSCILQSSNCKESARILVASPRGDILSVVVDAAGRTLRT